MERVRGVRDAQGLQLLGPQPPRSSHDEETFGSLQAPGLERRLPGRVEMRAMSIPHHVLYEFLSFGLHEHHKRLFCSHKNQNSGNPGT